jgi:Tol biopolymer transport system component
VNSRPAWSPDGKKPVFQSRGRSRTGTYEIWTINIDGTDAKRLVGGSDRIPFWSPDGKEIVWTHGSRLWIMDTSGSHRRPLTSTPAKNLEYTGDWSPKSNMIAYLAVDDNKSSLYTVRLIRPDGRGQRTLGAIQTLSVRWSRVSSNLYYIDGPAI